MRMVRRALLLGALLLCAGAPAQEAAAPLPAEVFFRDADIDVVRLSPSGRWAAMTTRAPGARSALVLFDLQEWKLGRVLAHFNSIDIGEFEWVNDDWLVFAFEDRFKASGDQRAEWPGLWSVPVAAGGKGHVLVQQGRVSTAASTRRDRAPLHPAHVLLHADGGNDEVIVGEWIYSASGEPEAVIAKRLNVVTGRVRAAAADAPGAAREWFVSPGGEPRAVTTRRGSRVALHLRVPGREGWLRVYESDLFEQPFTPDSVDSQGRLYVRENDASGFGTIKRYDVGHARLEAEPLVRTPGFDFVGQVITDGRGGRLLGVRAFVDAEVTAWTDERLKAMQQQADTRLRGRINRLTCRRCGEADMVTLVFSYTDRDPGQYWVHTATDGRWRKLVDVRSGIDARRMGSTDLEFTTARDGLRLPVWHTRPAGSRGPLPTVVLVHGGPWVRGRYWEWEPMAQFLASRGYLVLEPEFRGSRGYGSAHYRAGWKQWGLAMQDDIADALAWAVKAGHADPKRVCIAGASYGGYATLMGLIRQPDAYRCGAAWVAVTDPRLMLKWNIDSDMADTVRDVDLPRLIGDPNKDAAMLDSVTPLLRAAEIKAPLLLGVGGTDARVLPEHGERLREALTELGRPPQYVYYEKEGHNWVLLETRLDFARQLEAFLARHLAP
jgi:dienelactone hydrolase